MKWLILIRYFFFFKRLCIAERAFLQKRDYSLVAVHRLLIAAASLIVENGL